MQEELGSLCLLAGHSCPQCQGMHRVKQQSEASLALLCPRTSHLGRNLPSQQLPPPSSVSLSEQSQQEEGIQGKGEKVTDAPDHHANPHGSAFLQTSQP